MKCVHVIVKGYVQGVFFRTFTEKLARKHNIVGWVRNRTNGDVEIVAQGKDENVERFLLDLWNGPGKVEDVVYEYENPRDGLKGFKRLDTV